MVEAAFWDAELFAKQIDRELPGELHDYLVFFLPIEMNLVIDAAANVQACSFVYFMW